MDKPSNSAGSDPARQAAPRQGERLDGVMRRLKAQTGPDDPQPKRAPVTPVTVAAAKARRTSTGTKTKAAPKVEPAVAAKVAAPDPVRHPVPDAAPTAPAPAAPRLKAPTLPPLVLGPAKGAPKGVLRLVSVCAAALCVAAIGVGAIGAASGAWIGAEAVDAPDAPATGDAPVEVAALAPALRLDRPAAPAAGRADATPVAAPAPAAARGTARADPTPARPDAVVESAAAPAPLTPEQVSAARIAALPDDAPTGAVMAAQPGLVAPDLAAVLPETPLGTTGPDRAGDILDLAALSPDTSFPGIVYAQTLASAQQALDVPTAPGTDAQPILAAYSPDAAMTPVAGERPAAPLADILAFGPYGAIDALRVNVAAPNGVAAALLDEAAVRIAALGHARPDTGTVGFTISQSHVRYFDPKDREAAERIAAELDAPLRDFTDYGAGAGLVEVWLSGTPLVVDPAPSTPVRTARSTRTRQQTRGEERVPLATALSQLFGGTADVSRNRTRMYEGGGDRQTVTRASVDSRTSGSATQQRRTNTSTRATASTTRPAPSQQGGSLSAGGGSLSQSGGSRGRDVGYSATSSARSAASAAVSAAKSSAKSAAKAAKSAAKAAKSASKGDNGKGRGGGKDKKDKGKSKK